MSAMKIKPSHMSEMLKADRREEANRTPDARRKTVSGQHLEASQKPRQTDSPLREHDKFSALIETENKTLKPNQARDDSSREQQRDDDKKSEDRKSVSDGDKKTKSDGDKDSPEKTAGDGKSTLYESSSFGGHGGGNNSNFGGRGDVNQVFNLNENFAARSILHIADLERLVLTVRAEIAAGGKRAVYLQLKRSVLQGLQAKIEIDAAKVKIQFLASDEKSREELEKHTPELAAILRGRGINLDSLTTTTAFANETNADYLTDQQTIAAPLEHSAVAIDSTADNTFAAVPGEDRILYQA